VELELQSLANCLNWALAAGKIERRPELLLRFRDSRDIRHAREVMPACGDEVHALATRFFTPLRGNHNPGCSEVYGWLALWLPLTGMRIGEAVQLLANPQPAGVDLPPGYADDKRMRIVREKRGCNPWIRLDDPDRPHLRPLLDAIRAWHAAKYPHSPWLFPAADGGPLPTKRLTKAMAHACVHLGIKHRTAHGYRAYYASVRLAQGVDVEDVARELGQRSGEDLVRDVYGLDLDDFQADTFRGMAHVLTWLPNTAGKLPAWTWWTAQLSNIIPLAAGQ
jgi:integrase